MIMELIQPYLNDIVTGALGLLTFMALTAMTELRKRVLVWIDSRNDLRHQEIVKNIAEESFAYIEQKMKSERSQDKLNEAIFYASNKLEKRNLNITTNEIRGAIELAVVKFNKENKNN